MLSAGVHHLCRLVLLYKIIMCRLYCEAQKLLDCCKCALQQTIQYLVTITRIVDCSLQFSQSSLQCWPSEFDPYFLHCHSCLMLNQFLFCKIIYTHNSSVRHQLFICSSGSCQSPDLKKNMIQNAYFPGRKFYRHYLV